MTHVQLEKWMGLQERPWMEKNEQLQNDLQKIHVILFVFLG